MPTYEYQCNKCNHKLEELQSFNDAPLTKCPNCNKNELKRLVSCGLGFIAYKGGSGKNADKESMASKIGGRYRPMDSAEQKFEARLKDLENQ